MARIKRDLLPRADEYQKLRDEGNIRGEDNDCSVIALAAACNIPYAQAHQMLEALGRKRGKGTRQDYLDCAIRSLGFKIDKLYRWDFKEKFINKYPGNHKNCKGVTTHHPDRFPDVWRDGNTYLFFTTRHVGAVINGQNVDWTRGSAKRVRCIWHVTR